MRFPILLLLVVCNGVFSWKVEDLGEDEILRKEERFDAFGDIRDVLHDDDDIDDVQDTTCPTNGHVVSLDDARTAATASANIYLTTTNVGNNINGYVVDDIITATDRNLKAMVATNVATNSRMIIFRGTATMMQLGEQVFQGGNDIFLRDNSLTFGTTIVRVLTYIENAYQALVAAIMPYVTSSTMKYIVTGHSLGGAIASHFSLHASYFVNNPVWSNPNSALITFGENRLGNLEFATLHDLRIAANRKIRFVYARDNVPHIPITVAGHTFVHHSREVWIATTMLLGVDNRWGTWFRSRRWAWKICDNMDPTTCSNSLLSAASYHPLDHQMSHYISKLNDVPSTIYDKNTVARNSWDEAYRCSNA